VVVQAENAQGNWVRRVIVNHVNIFYKVLDKIVGTNIFLRVFNQIYVFFNKIIEIAIVETVEIVFLNSMIRTDLKNVLTTIKARKKSMIIRKKVIKSLSFILIIISIRLLHLAYNFYL